jgi:hypothetical protein
MPYANAPEVWIGHDPPTGRVLVLERVELIPAAPRPHSAVVDVEVLGSLANWDDKAKLDSTSFAIPINALARSVYKLIFDLRRTTTAL